MDILFEEYTANDGAGHTRLPLRVFGSATTNFGRVALVLSVYGEVDQITSGDGSVHLGAMVVRGSDVADAFAAVRLSFEVSGSVTPLLPSIAVGYVGTGGLAIVGSGTQVNFGDGYTVLPLSIFGSAEKAVGRVRLPMALYGSDGHVNSDRVAFLIEQPEIVSSFVVGMTESVIDSYVGRATAGADFIHGLHDLMRGYDSYRLLATALQSLFDKSTMYDLAELIYFAGLVDSFIASATIADTAQLTALLKDHMIATDAPTSISEILALLADSFYATLTLNTGEDVYTAWVMTPQTKAVRSYTNFPFNSFAQMDNMMMAAGPQGVYRLGGTTDMGDAIIARIRSGLTDMGSRQLKRIDRAYLGYRSTGALCLRVTATTQTGEKVVYTYQMVKQPADATRESRVQIGRGVKSVYWAFELCNDATGSDFALDNMTILPMVLTGKVI